MTFVQPRKSDHPGLEMKSTCLEGDRRELETRTAAGVLSGVNRYSSPDRVFTTTTAEHCDGVLSVVESAAMGRTEGLYLVQEKDARGPLKIGVAEYPMRRLVGVQVGNPRPLFLLGWVVAPHGLEKIIHGQLIHDRISGEWFKPTPYVWGVIGWHFAAIGLESCLECEHEKRCRDAGLAPLNRVLRHTCGRPSNERDTAKQARLAANLHQHMSDALEIAEFPATPSSREDKDCPVRSLDSQLEIANAVSPSYDRKLKEGKP